MLRTIQSYQSFRMTTGTTDVPAIPIGSNLKFGMAQLPKNSGSLAYYVAGFFLTLRGTITQGASPLLITDAQIQRALIQSIQLYGAWHGQPISPNHVFGYWLPTISAVGSGFRRFCPRMTNIPNTNAAFNFQKTIFIPLGLGNGVRPHHTAQLAVLYRQAYLQINFQALTGLTAAAPAGLGNATASWSNLTCQLSAVMFPEPEIRVGPGVEWIDYNVTANGSNTAQVRLESFGRKTQLENSEDGAGVAFAMWMDNQGGQPGANRVNSLTGLSIPFRSQDRTTHIEPIAFAQLVAMGNERAVGNASQNSPYNPATANAATNDTSDWPFHDENFNATSAPSTLSVTTGIVPWDGQNMRGLVIVPQPIDFQTSKMQVVAGDTDYYLDIDGVQGGFSGAHHTLVQHVRSWTGQGWDNALKLISDSGLIKDVFGSSYNANALAWQVKMNEGKVPEDVMPHKLRFNAMALKPRAHVERKSKAKGHAPMFLKR